MTIVCGLCGTNITEIYRKDKKRKLCDPCKEWKHDPHPSWND